jgi:hypothetical protein
MALASLGKYQEFSPSVLHLITTLKVLFIALPPTTMPSATQQEPRNLTRYAPQQLYDLPMLESNFVSPQATVPSLSPSAMLNDAPVFEDLQAFDVEFDPNDTSWLTTLPWDSFGQL